jgi:uncharacterized protein
VAGAEPEPPPHPDARWSTDEDGTVFLIGGECHDCSQRAFPRPRVCPTCHSEGMDDVRLSRTGVVYAFTSVHVAPAGFDSPYVLAYVDLPEDVRVLGQVQGDLDGLAVGGTVEVGLGLIGERDGRPEVSYVFQVGAAS